MKNKYNALIITCWSLLVICLVLKLIGMNWFEPAVDNERFINFCNFIDNKLWLKYIVNCIISLMLNSLVILAILRQKFYTKIQFIVYIPLIICLSLSSWNLKVLNILLTVAYYTLAIIWLKRKWYLSLLGFGLTTIFQLISIFTKNMGGWNFNLNDENTVIMFIMEIDSIIMITLYYLYSNHFNKERGEDDGCILDSMVQ